MAKTYRTRNTVAVGNAGQAGVLGTTGEDYFSSFIDRITKSPHGLRLSIYEHNQAMMLLMADIARSQRIQTRALSRIFKMLSLQNPYGTTFGFDLSLTGGSTPTQIDFVRGSHKNLPAGLNFKVPYMPVQTLILTNRSSTQSVKFSSNPTSGNLSAETTLLPQEKITIETKVPTIRRLNIAAPSGDAILSVTAVV